MAAADCWNSADPRGDRLENRVGAESTALTVGADNAVARTGRLDGFFKNEAIKILMPDSLRRVETGLRAVGYGPRVDEFILAMNRAAERAAASAKPIFWEAIQTITIEDAMGILQGGETAATEYSRERTEDGLSAAFRPIVQKATDEVGATRHTRIHPGAALRQRPRPRHRQLRRREDARRAVLRAGRGREEIRKDPAARITAILREVFGR